jgi:rSAM-associated Gly-rich repeat protein
MSLRHRTLKLVGTLIPAGLFGMSAILASTAAEASTTGTAGSGATTQPPTSVAGQLQAIRDAVTTTLGEGRVLEPHIRLAWWGNGDGRGWGNGGHEWGNAGHPGWGNGGRAWGNGHGGWANWRN